jgi:cobalt-zinc-cadmium resistance protein CzcA
MPPGYRLNWGGQFENQQRAAARLQIVVPIALAMIFLLLYLTFGSVRQSILVFCNVPFATIGGIIALRMSGEFLSVPASVGFIALLGIAVLNGVVMVTYTNDMLITYLNERRGGFTLREVVMEAARRRLRPVTLTAAIAALGLVPFLFATGPGSEIQRPLAIVVIGGLVTATLLTLIVLPLLYERFGLSRAARLSISEGDQSAGEPILDHSGLSKNLRRVALRSLVWARFWLSWSTSRRHRAPRQTPAE